MKGTGAKRNVCPGSCVSTGAQFPVSPGGVNAYAHSPQRCRVWLVRFDTDFTRNPLFICWMTTEPIRMS